MMLLIVRLISLRQLLLGTKVKTLLSLPRLLKFLTKKSMGRFVMGVMLKMRTMTLHQRGSKRRRRIVRQHSVAG
ncbi:hypothetical protein [Anaplasma phagocytophilum]|uniref:hypothetical protein n=1 Tax=Anaplasma phagocytophilum TaxID=948 RepID=UPI0007E0ED62|nr:hypothetical protein [Anaplasma phagocytophilum]SBO32807.1 hypothetical protein ANAPC3_01000 [Anaplasma phagocytophilum]SBO33127.1 hypothetical protein ANAPC2_01261 [Anaplasma phagocytophilum]SBO33682.1 hypothetical protein ANAPC4_01250 [Anaplasma phagocytophilum]